eukprot:scaffold318254_cov33-Tisochrysis_lutea.AAC.1
MVELEVALELEETLLSAVRQYLEGGGVDLSSVSLRKQEIERLVPRGVASFVEAGLLIKSGSMFKLAPHVMLALRSSDKTKAVDEQVAAAATAAAAAASPGMSDPSSKKRKAGSVDDSGHRPLRKRACPMPIIPVVPGQDPAIPYISSCAKRALNTEPGPSSSIPSDASSCRSKSMVSYVYASVGTFIEGKALNLANSLEHRYAASRVALLLQLMPLIT